MAASVYTLQKRIALPFDAIREGATQWRKDTLALIVGLIQELAGQNLTFGPQTWDALVGTMAANINLTYDDQIVSRTALVKSADGSYKVDVVVANLLDFGWGKGTASESSEMAFSRTTIHLEAVVGTALPSITALLPELRGAASAEDMSDDQIAQAFAQALAKLTSNGGT